MKLEKKVICHVYLRGDAIERPLTIEDLVDLIRSMQKEELELIGELVRTAPPPEPPQYPRFDHVSYKPCTWSSGKKGFRYFLTIEVAKGYSIAAPIKNKAYEAIKDKVPLIDWVEPKEEEEEVT